MRSWHALPLLVLLAACGGLGSPTAGPTGESAPPATIETVAPTTTMAPLVAGPVAAWGGRVVSTVCVVSEQSYPQVPGYRFDIEGVLRDLLAPSGIAVVDTTRPCDAILSVTMSLEGRPAEYKEFGTVYSGMLRRLDMTLVAADQPAQTYHHETDTQPAELASSLEPRDPAAFLTHYEDVWATISLPALTQWWGPAVAIELVPDETYGITAYSHLCDTAGFAIGACIPATYEAWRAWYAGVQPDG